MKKIAIIFFVALLFCGQTWAETIQITGATDTYDATINEQAPTTNYGSGEYLAVNAGYIYKTWIKFDLSGIPAGATINSAICSIYVHYDNSGADGAEHTLKVHRCLKNVSESGITWNKFRPSNNWETPGCGLGTDILAQAQDSIVLPAWGALGTGWTSVWDFNDETDGADDMTQGWVDEEFPNYGVVIRWVAASADCNQRSSEYASDKPRLYVDYTVAGVAGQVIIVQ